MKNTTLLILLSLFIISCGDKTREEVIENYDDGQKKLLVKYKGEGSKEVIVERITYNENGDTLILENDKSKMEREYYENGKIKWEGQSKELKKEGLWTYYYQDKSYKMLWKDGFPIEGKMIFWLLGTNRYAHEFAYPHNDDKSGEYIKNYTREIPFRYDDKGVIMTHIVKHPTEKNYYYLALKTSKAWDEDGKLIPFKD